MEKEFTAIILAAGKGTRMKSKLPKVLHTLQDRPLIYYILKQLSLLQNYIKQIVVVVGYQSSLVIHETMNLFLSNQIPFDRKKVDFVVQKQLLGTADAVKAAKSKVKYQNVLVACADTPLVKRKTLFNLINLYLKTKSDCVLLTAKTSDKTDLGLIVRDNKGNICKIVESIDLGEQNRNLNFYEVNSGIYIFKYHSLFSNISTIALHPKKKEFFLTDIIQILAEKNYKITSFVTEDFSEIMGINSVFDLLTAEQILRKQIINSFIERGVKILDPQTTFIDQSARIGKGTIIFPFTFIEKDVIIGNSCSIGPFIHLRQNTKVKDNTQLGNFVEICRSNVGKNVKIKHFSYVGDAEIADNVNIGAGTVFANFDGMKKNKTIIKKNAFIGSDTVLIAPVKVGQSAVTGAGSVVTKDVESKTVVVGVPARVLKKL